MKLAQTLVLAAALPFVVGAATETHRAQEPTEKARYICPPCVPDCHDEVYAEPGKCSGCGMPLVPFESVPKIVVVLFEGMSALSFAGPAGVLAQTEAGLVYAVSDTTDPLKSQGFLSVVPQYTFEDAPEPDVLILPSGFAARTMADDSLFTDWIRSASEKADHVLSIGHGAFFLAGAGLIEGLEVPTTPGVVAMLEKMGHKVKQSNAAVVRHENLILAREGAALDEAFRIAGEIGDPRTVARAAKHLGFSKPGDK